MGILIQPIEIGQVGVLPRTIKMSTTDSLATITTAGYLTSNMMVGGFQPTDVLDVTFSYVPSTGAGSYGKFTLSISSGVITLVQTPTVALVTVAGNLADFSNTVGGLEDSGLATAKVLRSSVNASTGANLITFDVTVAYTDLATAGSKILKAAASVTSQYKIRNLWANKGGTNFSGGGGDRLLAISDGTTVYSVIPATNIQTLVNSGWGITTTLPFPASAATNTSTVAGANLVALYSGGTTDYTAGSVVISGLLEKVTA